ncbi:chorismate mutase [Pseudomonas sp. B21-035]|uniref:chorismate mutase n=1 Tax=Pseudomonas sp. B21-035 TaxID=2895484 RepID=UPI00215FD580|nr:chorismate mutase [Pseudomonas sp. B21-035]UVL56709.1 chorismate mutase [Pseudomonas sp. B21-035]
MTRTPITLTLLALLTGCSTPPAPLESQVLLRTNTAWDGSPYPRYPDGPAELTLVKIHIPPETTLDWHSHPLPNAGYLLAGELLVETRDSNKQVSIKAGDALAEIVDGVHRGRTDAQAAELIVFYAGSQGVPLSQPAPATTPLTALLDSIDQRLHIAHAVALNKWDSGQPVEAPEREQQVIANAQSQALRFGVDGQRAALFFADQIEANKLLQYSALSRWHAVGSAPQTPRVDLGSQLRPQLDRLQRTLLSQLAEFDRNRPAHCPATLAQAIAQRARDPQQSVALIRATTHLCSPQ